jgi:hypothetical protein
MPDYKRKVFLVFFLCLVTVVLFAQTDNTDSSYKLVAVKNNFQKVYATGIKFFLKFHNDSSVQKCRGVFTGITNGGIIITTHKKGKTFLILPENILLLRKIKPGSRIIYAGIGTALTVGGAAVINSKDNTPGSAMRDALIIPVIGAGVYFLCAIPVSLLIEKIGEKKKVNGWIFKIENR